MKFSVITSSGGALGKTITLDENGNLTKEHSKPLTYGTIEQGSSSLENLPAVLSRMTSDQALCHGVPINGKKKQDLTIKDLEKELISKTKNNIHFKGSHLSMLDVDPNSQCPYEAHTAEALLRALSGIDPQWGSVGYVVKESSSSGLSVNGKPVSNDTSFHIYFEARNAEFLPEYMKAVFKLTIINGLGWIMVSKGASKLVRSCFDGSVFSAERLDFTAAPVLIGNGLTQTKAKPIFISGGVIDCSQIPKVDDDEYERIVNTLKGKSEVVKLWEGTVGKLSKKLSKEKKISLKDARAQVINRSNYKLNLDDVVEFVKFGSVGVSELLADPVKYNQCHCADPLEPELGTGKAMFFGNEDREPIIHSMLHGGINYSFRDNIKTDTRTIDPLKNLEPINPIDFMDAMVDEITSLNPQFYCSKKIREGFIQQGTTYNMCHSSNMSGNVGQFIVPSATGSGKSVSGRLYLALASKLNIAGLLVVGEVDVAIDAVRHINRLAGRKVAATHYKISDTNPICEEWCDLTKAPLVFVITHSMFSIRSETGRDINKFKNFNGTIRPVMIIDERINLIQREDFSLKAFEETAGILKRDNRLLPFADNLEAIVECFLSEKSGKFKELIHFDNIRLKDAVWRDFKKLATQISEGDYNLNRPFKGVRSEEKTKIDRVDAAKTLRSAAYVLSHDYNQFLYNSGKKMIQFQIDISNKFGTCVVLDASCAINPEYSARSLNDHKIAILKKIDSRLYNNVNLHVSTQGTRQSASGIIDEPTSAGTLQDVISDYYKAVLSITEPEDRVLVATFKAITPMFNELNKGNKQIKFVYWGSKDVKGSNEFKDFNKGLIIGWYRIPAHVHASTINAIKSLEKYKSLTNSPKSDVSFFDEKHISEAITQFFPRIRLRSCIDDDGNCKRCDLYLFTGGQKQIGNKIVNDIEIELPGLKVIDWKVGDLPKLMRQKSSDEKNADRILDLLVEKRKTYSDIFLSTVKKELGLKPYAIAKVIKTDYFKARLAEEDIVITKSKTRGKPKIFRFWAE